MGSVPPGLFEAVLELCPRDDRVPQRRVFQGVTADRTGTAIGRACTAAGVPAFSALAPWRVPRARIGEHVGRLNLAVTANTYTHVLSDEQELHYERMMLA